MTMKLGTQREWVRKLASSNVVVPLIERAIDNVADFPWTADFGAKAADDAWHPSGDCTPSLRDLYMKATDPQHERIGVGLRKTFAFGHFWHAWLQAVLVEDGLVAPEDIERRGMTGWGDVEPRTFEHTGDIPWKPWHWATGSIDVASFEVPSMGEKVILDFKTMRPSDFNLNYPPDWTAAKWECQLNVYMDWLDRDHAFIVGIDKTGGDFKEFLYVRNQALIDAIYLKWKIVAECIDEGIVPPEDEGIELPLKGPK